MDHHNGYYDLYYSVMQHSLSFQIIRHSDHSSNIGIIFEVYAPLGSPSRVRKQDSDPDPLDDPVIKEISNKHSATVGQVWAPLIVLGCV